MTVRFGGFAAAASVVLACASPGVASAQADAQSLPPLQLYGAVEFEADPEAAPFAPFADYLAASYTAQFLITVTPDGHWHGCAAAVEGQPEGLEAVACTALEQAARIAIVPGYDTQGHGGVFGVAVVAYRDITQEGRLPIQFTRIRTQPEVSLVISAPSTGSREVCEPFGVAGEVIMTDMSYDAACEAFLALDLKDRQSACRAGERYGQEQEWRCHIVAQPNSRAYPEVSVHVARIADAPAPVYSPPTDREQELLLTEGVRLAARLEYPARSLRYEEEGRVLLLLGYDRTGAIVSCRPTLTSGWAYLDNDSCKQVLRTGRMIGVPASFGTAPARYSLQPIRWQVEQ